MTKSLKRWKCIIHKHLPEANILKKALSRANVEVSANSLYAFLYQVIALTIGTYSRDGAWGTNHPVNFFPRLVSEMAILSGNLH